MLEAIILGVVQGITEFFPVSSTAHLVLIPWIFNWDGLVNSLPFDVALHAGTLMSLLVCFKKDIVEMTRKKRKLIFLIGIGTVPAVVGGLALYPYISGSLRNPRIIALMLVVFGLVMYAAERYSGKKRRNIDKLGVMDAVFVGLAQAVALVPGVSRSGVTISAGLALGMRREEAARFSFLLSMPVVAGAILYEGKRLLQGGDDYQWGLMAVGFAVSFVTGVGAIKFLLGFLKSHNMNGFVIYRFVLAGAIIGWIWLGG